MLSGRVFAFWLAAVLACPVALRAQTVIPEGALERHGLTRGWRLQVELNRAIDHIAFITQYGGALYVQTAHAFVHALDAETGKKIWSSQIGQTSQVSLAPGVNDTYLAVINGSTLFVLDRATGREKFRRVLGGAPGTGPALSDSKVYVFMVNGLIQGFDLEDQRALAWIYRADGRNLTQPVVSDGNLAWTTDKGYFYVATADPPQVRFRVETHAEISARPAHWTPYLYACSQSGFLYAVNEETGQTAWKFPAGSSLSRQPAAIGKCVYIVSDMGLLIAIDGRTGAQLWSARGIEQFCSASATHVYAVDQFNRLVILDAQHGTRLSTLPLGDVQIKLINQQTDRIYLASETGVFQCIHELGLRKPLVYSPPALKKRSDEADKRRKPATGESDESDDKGGAAGEKPDGQMEGAAGDEESMPEEEEKEGEDAESPFG
jgi:outer membrane protein assembly factor BamB